jgi:uncharacterized protein
MWLLMKSLSPSVLLPPSPLEGERRGGGYGAAKTRGLKSPPPHGETAERGLPVVLPLKGGGGGEAWRREQGVPSKMGPAERVQRGCLSFRLRLLMVLALTTTAEHARAASPPAMELKWAQLVPPAPPKLKPFFSKPGANANPGAQVPGQPFDLGAVPNDGTPAPDPKGEGRWMSGASKAASEPVPVVEALNGQRVQIGGYIVPLDFDATTVKEFLLVPFVGACIHVPPPPANQIIYVKSAKGIEVGKVFDPIYVTGTMSVSFTSTGLADAGYTISAEQVERK